jgi:N-methylhydantoinase B
LSTLVHVHIGRETTVDPVTFEVIRNRLASINHEQSLLLKHVAGSPVVTDANDFNVGLYLPDGSIVSMGLNVIYHAGSMSPVIAHTLTDCGENPGIREGDAFFCNDPYKGALHPPDVTLVEPIFFEDELVAWTGACAHELDVGGMEHGSWSPKARDIQQEGMIIPPLKLIEQGELRHDLWNMILGMSRLPFVLSLDFKAMMAANTLARRRLVQLLERYGLDVVRSVMYGLLDQSERLFRERLLTLPDGTFRGRNYLDHDGHENELYTVEVELRKEADRLVFDYSNTSAQAPGFINCTGMGLRGGVYSAVFPILAAGLSWNHGIIRAIDVVCPDGLLVNATWPAPVGSATLAGIWLAESVAVEAASRLAFCHPEQSHEAHATTGGAMPILTVAGLDQYGESFGTGFTDCMAGGAGAYAHRPGTDYNGMHCIITQQISNVESIENFSPLLYLRRSALPDSGGAGEFRGGAGLGEAIVLHGTDLLHMVVTTHGVEVPNSLGLFGGAPGSGVRIRIGRHTDLRTQWATGKAPRGVEEVTGDIETLVAKPGHLMFGADDVFEWTFVGGGGVGDPLFADPVAVARDVKYGVVTIEAAEAHYGVRIDAHGAVNGAETTDIRRSLLEARRGTRRSESVSDAAARIAALSPYLSIVAGGAGRVHACECGACLGPASGNYKDYCVTQRLAMAELHRDAKLHRDLALYRYTCPGCGRTHGVEVLASGTAPLHEVELEIKTPAE